jgi:hypothetical protein
MEQHALKNINKCLNTNIYSYIETSGGQSSNPYLNAVDLLTPELIRNLWQLNTAVSLHWCLIRALPLGIGKAWHFEVQFIIDLLKLTIIEWPETYNDLKNYKEKCLDI